jgi:hypothetical protein
LRSPPHQQVRISISQRLTASPPFRPSIMALKPFFV